VISVQAFFQTHPNPRHHTHLCKLSGVIYLRHRFRPEHLLESRPHKTARPPASPHPAANRSHAPRALRLKIVFHTAARDTPAWECGSPDSSRWPGRSACETPLRSGTSFRWQYFSSKAKPRVSRPLTCKGKCTDILRSDLCLAVFSLIWLMGWAPPIGRFPLEEALHTFSTISAGVRAVCTMRLSSLPFPTP